MLPSCSVAACGKPRNLEGKRGIVDSVLRQHGQPSSTFLSELRSSMQVRNAERAHRKSCAGRRDHKTSRRFVPVSPQRPNPGVAHVRTCRPLYIVHRTEAAGCTPLLLGTA